MCRFEDYFKRAWYKLRPNLVERPAVLVKGLDYTLFKLFYLSILWRA